MYLQSMRFLTVNERELIETAVAYAVYHVLPRKSPAPRFRKGRCGGFVGLDLHSTNKRSEALRQAKLASLPPSAHAHIGLWILIND